MSVKHCIKLKHRLLLAELLLSVGLQGLIALLLLPDPHQVLLGAAFEGLLILEGKTSHVNTTCPLFEGTLAEGGQAWAADLLVALQDPLVLLQSLEELREGGLQGALLLACLLLLRQGLVQLGLGLGAVPLPLLLPLRWRTER